LGKISPGRADDFLAARDVKLLGHLHHRVELGEQITPSSTIWRSAWLIPNLELAAIYWHRGL
jgi:hypothetical protein